MNKEEIVPPPVAEEQWDSPEADEARHDKRTEQEDEASLDRGY